MACLPAAPQVPSLAWLLDDHMTCCGIIGSCQSAVTSEFPKYGRSLSREQCYQRKCKRYKKTLYLETFCWWLFSSSSYTHNLIRPSFLFVSLCFILLACMLYIFLCCSVVLQRNKWDIHRVHNKVTQKMFCYNFISCLPISVKFGR